MKEDSIKHAEEQLQEEKEKLLAQIKEKALKRKSMMTSDEPETNFRQKSN